MSRWNALPYLSFICLSSICLSQTNEDLIIEKPFQLSISNYQSLEALWAKDVDDVIRLPFSES